MIEKNVRMFLAIASIMVALAIGLGAFGAHGLKSIVSESLLKIYHTGVEYQFYNSLGLFGAAFVLYLKPSSKKPLFASWFILIGTLIFSFSLYLLVLLNMPILGAVTPIGGVLQIIGWLFLAYSLFKD